MVNFRQPTPNDLQYVAATMRKADVDEVWASNRLTPLEALTRSVDVSQYATTVLFDDEPVAVLGLVVKDMLSGVGVPWLLANDAALKHKRAFFELSPPAVADMLDICPTLYNYVDARNHASIRWLKWLGFEFEDAKPYGALGLPFHRFYRHRGH